MASLSTLISNIRSTASGPTMREKIAQSFEAARDGYVTQTYSKTVSCAAGAIENWNFSITKSGYTAIGVISAGTSSEGVLVGNAYLYSASSAKVKTYNPGSGSVSATINIIVLYKNDNNA